MIDFFLILFGSVGLSHILVDSPLMAWPKRKLGILSKTGPMKGFFAKVLQMLGCYQCSGVWAGWACGLLAFFVGVMPLWQVLLTGFATAVFSPLLTVVITYFNAMNTKILQNVPEENEVE